MSKKMIVSSILLLLLLVMIVDFRINNIGVFEGYFRQMETNSLRELQEGYFNVTEFQGLEKVIKTDEQIIELADKEITGLQIKNPLGSVIITGEDRQNLELSYRITLYSEKKLAEDILKSIQIIDSYHQKTLELSWNRVEIPSAVRGVKIDYELKVPRELALDISNRYGKLMVSGMTGNVILSNSYDELRATDIEGEGELLARHGNLVVENISGPVKIDTAYNNNKIYNLGSSLSLNSRYGPSQLANIKGNVDLDCSYGNLDLENIQGDVNFNSRYTQVRGRGLEGKVKGKMQYGSLNLMEITNSIAISGNYTNLDVDLADSLNDYQVICNVRYGDIRTNLSSKVEVKDNQRSLNMIKGSGSKEINLKTERANISIYQ